MSGINRHDKEDKDLGGEGYFETKTVPLPHFRDKGSALFFPSFSYHRVKPVTRGIRRSLVCWFRGPKWT
jgi:predicted 2-oxoglutarate/Fe(II)-dependent dioxygenase YbiX